ncbi:MAG TPA: hypothetical protein VGL97_25285 [Bryobacteraceae bacterium]
MAIKTILSFCLAAVSLGAQSGRVLMDRYDHFTTTANTHETALNAANVNADGFGKLYSDYVDGAVYGQPLYLPNVAIAGHDVHNVLYVATMNDKVYAFDADRKGAPLWMRDFTDELAGVTPVPVSDITHRNDLNIVGNAGIESTPVIDPASQSMYLVARTKENGRYLQRLHKLDVRDGKDQLPAAEIDANVSGSAQDAVAGVVHFDAKGGNQRCGLTLVNGRVVIAWASHEDIRPYHGWIMAYDAATLQQTGVLCITPDTADGGIWQSGRAPAVDPAGRVYFETGNGGWDGERNFGNSLLKLNVGGRGIEVEDFFTPHDYEELNARDADLGSTGPLLIPGTNILVGGNKRGVIFLLDSNKLGRMTPDDGAILQALELKGGRIMAGPAYWDGSAGLLLFVWCETDFPVAFRFDPQLRQLTPYAKGSVASHGSPGGAIAVSSDGKKAGTGVLWGTVAHGRSADHGNAPGVLHAFNAETLAEIWNSEQDATRDRLGTLVKFVPPLVIGSKVYVPNYDNAVNVYGLLGK